MIHTLGAKVAGDCPVLPPDGNPYPYEKGSCAPATIRAGSSIALLDEVIRL
ncbi:MAG: hypothetical protein R2911_15700 [Caldilineaceae bacterium]